MAGLRANACIRRPAAAGASCDHHQRWSRETTEFRSRRGNGDVSDVSTEADERNPLGKAMRCGRWKPAKWLGFALATMRVLRCSLALKLSGLDPVSATRSCHLRLPARRPLDASPSASRPVPPDGARSRTRSRRRTSQRHAVPRRCAAGFLLRRRCSGPGPDRVLFMDEVAG